MAIEMNVDVVALMDEQEAKAAERENQPKRSFKPTFLKLSDKQKCIFRPLVNLDGAAVMHMHYKYNQHDWKLTIDAVCAAEDDKKPCHHCIDAKSDKKLTADKIFLLPVFVYKIWYTKAGFTPNKNIPFRAGEMLMDKDENDNEVPVSGILLLKLSFERGSLIPVAQSLKGRYKEGDNLTRRDFTLERFNNDTTTYYVLDAKDPSQFEKRLAPVTVARIRERVFEACPPRVAGDNAAPARGATVKADSNDIPVDEDEIAVF